MKKTLPVFLKQLLVLFFLSVSINLLGQKIDSTFTSPLVQRASEVNEIVKQPDNKLLLAGDIAYYDSKSVGKVIRINLDGSLDKSLQAVLPADFIPLKMELMSSGNILVYDYSRIFKLGPNGRLKNQIRIQDKNITAVLPLANDKIFVTTDLGGLYRYKADFTIDSTFPNQDQFADGPILDIKKQDNNFVICGSFGTVNGVLKNDLARLFSNGTVDNTFDTGTGTNDWINGIIINPADSMIYPLAYISSFNGVFFLGMSRLNKNGAPDESFRPYNFSMPFNLFFTSDNKIVSCEYGGIKKYNYDGTTDTNFTPIDNGFFLPTLEQLSDGTLLVASLKKNGGDYGILKFSANGIKIPTYNLPVSRVGTITTMDRINKKLIVAGEFFMLNKHRTNNVGRLNANGSVDTNFKATNNDGSAYKCMVLSDGKILVSSFDDFSRLMPNGELDPTFQFSPYKDLYQVEKFHVLPDGKILGAGPNGINRLNSDGSGDSTFNQGTGYGNRSSRFDMGVQSSGKIIYAGFFNEYNGTPVNNIVRLNNNASLDPTFNIGTGPNNQIFKMEVLSTDQLLLGGFFDQYNGTATPGGLVKVKKDGALDTAFHTTFDPFTLFFDIKKFGQKILVSTQLGRKFTIAAVNFNNGAASTDFTLPSAITSFNNQAALHVQNSNTFYILGNLTIAGQSRPSSITKINYTPVAPSATLARVASNTEVSRDAAVNFQVYPNPSQREIIFDVSQTYDLRIVKYTGEVVLETSINASKNSIDISTLKPDTYVIQLSTGKKRQTSILIKN